MKTGIRYRLGVRCHKCNQRTVYEEDGQVYCDGCDQSHFLTVFCAACFAIIVGGIIAYFVVK